jgi:O-antigen/teichoic acid export membrane protein
MRTAGTSVARSASLSPSEESRRTASATSGAFVDTALQKVARGSITALFVYSMGIGLTYCSQLFVARVLGAQSYGEYAYVFAWISILAYVSTLGFDTAILRFVPAYEARRAWSLQQGVIRYAQRSAAAVGFTLTALGASIVWLWVQAPQLRDTFLFGLALMPLLALIRVRCSIARAFGGVISSIMPDRVVREGVLIGVLAVIVLAGRWTIDARLVMFVAVLSAAVALGVTAVALRKRKPTAFASATPQYDAPVWRKAAVPLMILGAAEMLLNRTGTILLGSIGATNEAGVYSLAFNISLVVTVPRIALNTLFAPTAAGLYARNEMAMLQTLVTKTSTWTFLAGLSVAGTLFVVAGPFLAWFGPSYDSGAAALRILLISQLVAAGSGSQLYIMTMTGQERAAALLLTCVAIANAVVSAALTWVFGLVGAAIATSIAFVVWNSAMAIFIYRRLGLRPGILGCTRSQSGAPNC